MTRTRTLPIGVDLGCSATKLVQAQLVGGEAELLAVGSVLIPDHLRNDQLGRLDYLARHIPKAIHANGFKGKKCIIALPAAKAFVRHVRIPMRDAQATEAAVLKAVRVELPYPVNEAVVRHIVVGEAYENGQMCQEVIVVAMPNSIIKAYLNMFSRAGLEVLGVSIEPAAIVKCFSQLLPESDSAVVFVDLGSVNTQVTISRGKSIVFSRSLHGGSDQLTRAIAQGLGETPETVNQMRKEMQDSKDLGPVGGEINRWLELWLDGVCADIDNCLRYYESTFRSSDFSRVIFTGGQARDKGLCQAMAKRLNLPAQIGDALAMLKSDTEKLFPGGNNLPQTIYAVGVGLSLSGAAA
jgi:type IV pilus assembly protein PilM